MGTVQALGERQIHTVKARLLKLIQEKSLIEGPITLSQGQHSSFYFDCKRVTLSSAGAPLVADVFLSVLESLPEQPYAIGGLTHGADPIIGAVQMRALEQGISYEGFYVRKEPKKHGTKQWIENQPPRGSNVVIVDDVVTTGGSVKVAVERIREAGCTVLAVICLIDRNQGGNAAIRNSVQNYRAIYTRDDFPSLNNP